MRIKITLILMMLLTVMGKAKSEPVEVPLIENGQLSENPSMGTLVADNGLMSESKSAGNPIFENPATNGVSKLDCSPLLAKPVWSAGTFANTPELSDNSEKGESDTKGTSSSEAGEKSAVSFGGAASNEMVPMESLEVEVNGKIQKINSGESIAIVNGDSLRIRDAVLRNTKAKPASVLFVGLFQTKKHPHIDDRGYLIRTERDLIAKRSVDGHGLQYKIVAKSSKYEHGVVLVNILPPKLSQIDLEINGQKRQVSEGDVLTVKHSDKIKIHKISTNFENVSQDVSVSIVPKTRQNDAVSVEKEKTKNYEMQLMRKRVVFARIPLSVGNL